MKNNFAVFKAMFRNLIQQM